MKTWISIVALVAAAGVSAISLADEAAIAAKAQQAAAPATQPSCLQETGSRLKRAKDDCIPVPGQVFTQEDLQSTGATNAADALRLLSPAMH